jgi:hypothetical protein
MARIAFAMILLAACGPETTSFRTTDRGDGKDRDGPPAAAYDVRSNGDVASVHVWSNGGYIGNTESPMTHIGFEIENTGTESIGFDGDMLQLVIYDSRGATLPATAFVVVTPIGPALVTVAPGATQTLEAYFELPVRPRVVQSMRVRWGLRMNDARYTEYTHFVRDDEFPVLEYRPATTERR